MSGSEWCAVVHRQRVSRAEKTSLQHQYDTTIEEINRRMSQRAKLQITLNETRDTVRETNEHVSVLGRMIA